MSTRSWVVLDVEAAAPIVAQANPLLRPFPFDPESTRVEKRLLPFYEYVSLYRLTEQATVPPVTKHALVGPLSQAVLDGTPGPVMLVNRHEPIKLYSYSIKPYVAFYLEHVDLGDYRHVVAEDMEDLEAAGLQDDLPQGDRDALEGHLRRPEVSGGSRDDPFRVRLTALAGTDLVALDLVVAVADGDIELTARRILADGLPVRRRPRLR